MFIPQLKLNLLFILLNVGYIDIYRYYTNSIIQHQQQKFNITKKKNKNTYGLKIDVIFHKYTFEMAKTVYVLYQMRFEFQNKQKITLVHLYIYLYNI